MKYRKLEECPSCEEDFNELCQKADSSGLESLTKKERHFIDVGKCHCMTKVEEKVINQKEALDKTWEKLDKINEAMNIAILNNDPEALKKANTELDLLTLAIKKF